ncbi:hypothetical protein QWY85_04705 [Neolewinella lacunae]|uniref:Uncharacterized protein n=1 Tax=Neolewinella lacunae TaxID=1517758 RepID=A0A923PPB4_9BACT|nr:hypothetical protein [Neolewinella lacunae]MBC6996095.1 hypothetical protein [Neolewinella lacunae]MDN3633948.1 hypothetical protein [Neolewinella lacunae]
MPSISFAQGVANALQISPNASFSNISSSARSKLDRMRANDAFHEISPIFLADIATFNEGADVPIQLPRVKSPVFIRPIHVELKTNGDYDWYGEMERNPGV